MRRDVSGHDPLCEAHTLREVSEREGWDSPPEDIADTVAFMLCRDGCPSLARAIERGRELAELHGW